MARMLQRCLSEEGHQVDTCSLGEDAQRQIRSVSYDVAVPDSGLPNADGVSLLRKLRDLGLTTSVLMLTACGTTGEKVPRLARRSR